MIIINDHILVFKNNVIQMNSTPEMSFIQIRKQRGLLLMIKSQA